VSPNSKYRAVDGIILLDKPSGLTSNAVLQQVRRMLEAEKAGHTGSLDPLATGMLPICLGTATRLSGYLLDSDKTYLARARLGLRTDTGDSEGQVVERSDSRVTESALRALIPAFSGSIAQTPPMYSAIKRSGRKLYELAREGIEVERAPRTVVIHALTLTAFDGQSFEFTVHCSKGTYIRTLAEDWVRAAGGLAHLVALRRTGVTPFDSRAMVSLEELEAQLRRNPESPGCLLPVGAALAHWTQWMAGASEELELSRGRRVEVPRGLARGGVAVVNHREELLGIADHDGQGGLMPRRWLSRGPVDPRTGLP